MIVKYVVAEDAECEFEQIRSIVNSGQTFISLIGTTRLSLGELRTPDGTPPSAKALRAFVATRLALDVSETPTLLITGREIQGTPEALSVKTEERFTVISEYRSSLQGRAAEVAFVRRILHAMMRLCVERSIDDAGCVCGTGNDFVYLSLQAEDQLRNLGYRDGIRDLLRFINWLNQSRANPKQPMLKPSVASGLPLVTYFAKQIVKEEGLPFSGKIVLMVLHFLSDLIPFVKNVIRLGACPDDIYLVAKPYPYPARDKICHELELLGVQFRRATENHSIKEKASEVLALLRKRATVDRKKIVTIEDGGYFAPLMHRPENRDILDKCVGIVEQTTKGIRSTEREVGSANIAVPILSVAKSSFKDRYESPEIGRATVQNISRFVPNVKLSGRRAVVFGFGSIGLHVAEALNRSFNMGVSVVDNDSEKLLLANHRKDIVTEAKRSFSQLAHKLKTRLVVGTTGGGKSGKPSVTAKLMTTFPSGTILVSTSSDRTEFDIDGLRRLACGREENIEEGNTKYTFKVERKWKSLFLLAEGYPINFYGSDSVPNETIDPIMALLLLCAVELSSGRRFKPRIDLEAVDNIVRERSLVEKFLEVHVA